MIITSKGYVEIFLVVVVILMVAFFYSFNGGLTEDREDVLAELIDRLPKKQVITGETGSREVLFGREILPWRPAEEMGALDKDRDMSGKDPLAFLEDHLKRQVSDKDLDGYSDDIYVYTVSIHPRPLESKLYGVVQEMNWPDDSVGGRELRFEFDLNNNEDWELNKVTASLFCRRPGDEYWVPEGELCP